MSTSRSRTSVLGSLWSAVRAASRPGSPGVVARLRALPRLMVATATGRYHGASTWRLLAIVAAGLYVVSPVDLVPEGVLGIFGLADDAMVLSWLAVAVVNETEDYLAWESDPLRAAAPGGPGAAGAAAGGAGARAQTGSDASGATVRGSVV